MLTIITIDGYLGIFRRPRLRDIVKELAEETNDDFKQFSYASSLLGHDTYRAKKVLRNNASSKNSLLLIGKSLGAFNILTKMLFSCEPSIRKYAHHSIITIDACWPLLTNWTPNLNYLTIKVPCSYKLNKTNIFVLTKDKDKVIAGCRVANSKEVPISRNLFDVDHFSITNFYITRRMIRNQLEKL